MSSIVFDLETNGVNLFDAEIITGFFIHADEFFNIESTYEIKCNPREWSVEAERVHGITREEASNFEPFKNAYKGLIDWIKSCDPNQMWMHTNSKMFGKVAFFDHAILRMNLSYIDDEAYFKVGSIKPYSTHSLCKILQDRFNFEGFSLDLICKELGVELKHHESKSDALACLEIIKQLLPLTTLEAINDYERGIKDERISTSNSTKPRKSKRTSRLV